ncbi:hypothetical protein GCM10010174_83840 [Kutzneria viridogrisea]|uniref:Uncharacterized protein n=1 Tax=Kutzneria viridogrisea TaxID=47990 RepID=A0ABR6BF99_9PSEU|nr:hypothetical protein [Kutzneria viridogrisea]
MLTLAARDPGARAVVSQVPYLGLVRKRLLPQLRALAALALRIGCAARPTGG